MDSVLEKARTISVKVSTEVGELQSGNEWGPSVLGRLLRAERIAGMRRHRDQVFAGGWEPIVDLATFYALAEALGESKRRTVRRGIKRHLLTGIARCSLCGQGMGTRIPKPGGGVRYACVTPQAERAVVGSLSSPAPQRRSWSGSQPSLPG